MNKILIVEDERALQDVYTILFKLENFEVFQASNGQEAIDQLKTIKPDVILLDVLMPVMSGIEFLKTVKPQETIPDIKILVLSNLSDAKTLSDLTELGATKYILKASASPKELVAAVKTLLK